MDNEAHWTTSRGFLLALIVSLPGPTRAADLGHTPEHVIRILCRPEDENDSAVLVAEIATVQGRPLRVVCTAVDGDGRDISLSAADTALVFCGPHLYVNGSELKPITPICQESVIAPRAGAVSPDVSSAGEGGPGTAPDGGLP